jgi:hypothetical protein
LQLVDVDVAVNDQRRTKQTEFQAARFRFSLLEAPFLLFAPGSRQCAQFAGY